MCTFPRFALVAAMVGGASAFAASEGNEYQTVGVVDGLPVFYRQIESRIVHPLAWTSGNYADFDDLDFPDVAGIACPKPLLFFNGLQDHLFPPEGVRAAYAKMHAVWSSQKADDRLVTRFWDVKHTFNAEMQDAAFAWLDQVMAAPKESALGKLP